MLLVIFLVCLGQFSSAATECFFDSQSDSTFQGKLIRSGDFLLLSDLQGTVHKGLGMAIHFSIRENPDSLDVTIAEIVKYQGVEGQAHNMIAYSTLAKPSLGKNTAAIVRINGNQVRTYCSMLP